VHGTGVTKLVAKQRCHTLSAYAHGSHYGQHAERRTVALATWCFFYWCCILPYPTVCANARTRYYTTGSIVVV